jgi:hypothetical protein
MHALGVATKGGRLIPQQIREADAADNLQDRLDGHCRIEGDGRGTHRLGRRGRLHGELQFHFGRDEGPRSAA